MAKNKMTSSDKTTEKKKPSVYVTTPRSPKKTAKASSASAKGKGSKKEKTPARPSVYVTKPADKKVSSVYKKNVEPKKGATPAPKSVPVKPKPSVYVSKPGAPPKRPVPTVDKKQSTDQPDQPKYKDLTKLLDALRHSELLKEYTSPPAPAEEKKAPVPKKPAAPKQEKSTGPLTAAPFILIVDDNEVQLFLMKKIVEECGYQCITTNAPETAVRIIAEKQPAAVFCDVNFGIGNPTGLDVFINIRKKNISVPFIIVSAFMQQEFIDKAKEIGIHDYLLKPVDKEQVTAVLKKHIHS